MDSNNYVSEIAKALNKILFILLFVVSAVAVAQTILIFYMYVNKEVQFVPPVTTQAYSASQVSPDESYLQMMSGWIIALKLNVTPENVDKNFQQLKRYAAPRYYSVINKKLQREATFIKKDKVSANLHINDFDINLNALTVVVTGVLYKAVGSREIENQKRYYRISYEYEHGTLRFKDIQKVKVKRG